MKKKLLLHVCCGPCSLHVMQKLQADFAVSGFFYNPNIQPFREFEFRRLEVAKIAEKLAWPMVYGAYDMAEWFAAVRGLEREPERGRRCPRLFPLPAGKDVPLCPRACASPCVASTLSISPYKVTAQINGQGLALAREVRRRIPGGEFQKKRRLPHRPPAGGGVRGQAPGLLRLRFFQGGKAAAPAQMTVEQAALPPAGGLQLRQRYGKLRP